jgi:hypothetical protein
LRTLESHDLRASQETLPRVSTRRGPVLSSRQCVP